MFTLDPIHPIYSCVIEIVAVYPRITIGKLHEHLKRRKIDISLAHLYRVVSRMTDAQVITKVKGELLINLMWVSYMEFIIERAKKVTQNVSDFPLEPGKKRVYEARSLLDVEAVWNHVLIALYRTTQEKQLYKYYSHAWWQLGRNAEELSFYKRLKEGGIDCHWVFGNDTFLDKAGAQRISEVFPAVTIKTPPFPSDGYNLNVYGEYVVECILPEKIAKHFSFFFGRVKSMKDFDNDLFLDIFAMQAPYKLTVWRNPAQADLLRKRLQEFI